MKCSDCRYFQEFKEPRSADDPADGFCRARSPRVFPDMEDSGYLTLSPVVDESYWCGEFKERDLPAAKDESYADFVKRGGARAGEYPDMCICLSPIGARSRYDCTWTGHRKHRTGASK